MGALLSLEAADNGHSDRGGDGGGGSSSAPDGGHGASATARPSRPYTGGPTEMDWRQRPQQELQRLDAGSGARDSGAGLGEGCGGGRSARPPPLGRGVAPRSVPAGAGGGASSARRLPSSRDGSRGPPADGRSFSPSSPPREALSPSGVSGGGLSPRTPSLAPPPFGPYAEVVTLRNTRRNRSTTSVQHHLRLARQGWIDGWGGGGSPAADGGTSGRGGGREAVARAASATTADTRRRSDGMREFVANAGVWEGDPLAVAVGGDAAAGGKGASSRSQSMANARDEAYVGC